MYTHNVCNRRRPAAVLAMTLGAALGWAGDSAAQEIGEIVVTARRVEEDLMKVPLAITAFDSAAIESAAITSLNDVAALTPGLYFFSPIGENLPSPIIRGIVAQDIFGDNTAAIFVDGVYISGREGLNFSQLDVERIEVLKGPQSSAYGRNAFSGAINYVTRAPSDVFEAKAEAEAGNRGRHKVMGQVSGPIFSDALTGRVSALYEEWDGSYDNTLAPGNDIGGVRLRSVQGRLRWRPTDALDINLALYDSNDEIDESALAALPLNCEDQVEQTTEDATQGPRPRLQNFCGEVPELDKLPDALDGAAFPARVANPGSITDDSMPKLAEATGEDRDVFRGSLNIAWDTGFGTLALLTGYSDTEQNSVSDFSRSAGDTLPFAYCDTVGTVTAGVVPSCGPAFSWAPMGFIDIETPAKTEEWSQEVRFTGPQDQRLRYVTGAYVFDKDFEEGLGEIAAARQLPGSILPGGDISVGPVAYPTALGIGTFIFGPSLVSPQGALDPLGRPETTKTERAWSVFAAVDYDITEAVVGRAEVRYTHNYQQASGYLYERCGLTSSDPNSDPGDYPLLDYADPEIQGCVDDYYDLRVLPPAQFLDQAERFSSVTGRLSLDYKFDSGWMAYGSVAWGEKPGGVLILTADVVEAGGVVDALVSNTFDREQITAYEIGLKGYTRDRRIRLDLALFYNDWQDMVLRQLTDTLPDDPSVKLDQPIGINVNAGDADVWGWELTTDIAFTEYLTGRLTAAYTDSQLTNARQDTYALFPTLYTTAPDCAPDQIQAIPDTDTDPDDNLAQNAKASDCRKLSGDVSGNTNLRQPEWTGSASLTYRRQLSGEWDWSLRGDANYTGKIFIGNDNQSWLPARTVVNLRLGLDSPRYSLEFWVRNLFENDSPTAAFRDIYWTNDADTRGLENPATIRDASTFDDFPPLRYSVTYPSLRTFGVAGKMRFGGAEK